MLHLPTVALAKVMDFTASMQSIGLTKILISCSGLGMGNVSRIAAILESLHTQNSELKFRIFSWGAGYSFLDKFRRQSGISFELEELEHYRGSPFLPFVKNNWTLRKAVRDFNPNLILLDSDYHFPAYLGAGCPVVFIGQAADVLERVEALNYRPKTWTETSNLLFREHLDRLVQQLLCRKVLVPSFESSAGENKKFKKIPLIVRREFTRSESKKSLAKIGVLLSGSGLQEDQFIALEKRYGLKVISPRTSKVPSRAEMLDDFDIVITQGGLSSISEVISRKKFLVVVPIPDHPEQILNAIQVERLGLGMRASHEHLKNFPKLMEEISKKFRTFKPKSLSCNGAQHAANAIIQLMA